MELLWPVTEFRYLPKDFTRDIRRYANGEWIPDDGEYDLAFIGFNNGFPMCLYVSHPYQKNIVYSWTTGHWSEKQPLHKSLNAWHYELRPGTNKCGGAWNRDRHPNELACRSGVNKL